MRHLPHQGVSTVNLIIYHSKFLFKKNFRKIKKMISENDENIDEFSQVPEFTPNKQLTLTLLNLEVVLLVAKISQKKFNMDKIKQMSRKY